MDFSWTLDKPFSPERFVIVRVCMSAMGEVWYPLIVCDSDKQAV
ncbi:hypothetical protein RE6C_00591 [Rhodopirellula europaea 6C]|uniref:Uncharacterized protein n=1 Tax=Rhodopirellula europaea 6C TaxID=1263867 RepID=M2ANH2_9BACT|nr:hypothetical protein RE6C_00591 [Rhodopirellula europaea 6C]